jgi:hypothetical protein
LGDDVPVEWGCERKFKRAGSRERWDERPRLAWSLAALSVAMFVGGCALTVLSLSDAPATQPSGDWGTASALGGLVIFLPFLAFPLVGALIASRGPHNPIGWICLAAGLFWMLIVIGDSVPTGSGPYPVTIDALTQWIWIPPWGCWGST